MYAVQVLHVLSYNTILYEGPHVLHWHMLTIRSDQINHLLHRSYGSVFITLEKLKSIDLDGCGLVCMALTRIWKIDHAERIGGEMRN